MHAAGDRAVKCGIRASTDVITGFCSETESEHQDTLSLMELVQYDMAYMFFYSERPGTLAARKYADDIPHADKIRRLNEIIALQTKHSLASNKKDIGKTCRILVEKTSRRSENDMCGRNDQNKMVVFPAKNIAPGTYVNVSITGATSATLLGVLVA